MEEEVQQAEADKKKGRSRFVKSTIDGTSSSKRI